VFRVNIADKGLSISFFKAAINFPVAGDSFSFLFMYEGVIESRTASQTEQRNENIIETPKKTRSKPMFIQISVCVRKIFNKDVKNILNPFSPLQTGMANL